MGETRPPLVAVIDDSAETRRVLEVVLGHAGFRVRTAQDGVEGLALLDDEHPDLFVLDLLMPGMDGFEVCREIRSRSDAYVIMLTSKTDEVDRVLGLTIGADDYLIKPSANAELVARIRAMLRRPRQLAAGGVVRRIADLEIDLDAHEVRQRGAVVPLTRIEFALLDALSEHPRRVQSAEQLLVRIWGAEWAEAHHLIEVHVSKLRRKLGDDSRDPTYVLTVRGAGYRMCDTPPVGGSPGSPPADGTVHVHG
jgi:DNA-binding response OmpR family regulator